MATKNPKTTKGSASQIANTRTKSKPLDEGEFLNAIGATGTYIVNGFLETDYRADLSGKEGLAKYDEMRRSDSKIRQSLMVCMLPILSTEWYIEPAKDPETGEVGEAQQEVADFVSKALFEKMEITWLNYLTEVLTMLPFGFSLFEKVYTADEFDDHVWLKTLGYRKQTTIDKWEMEDGSPGITQQLPSAIVDPYSEFLGQSRVSIPASKMLLFSYQREGDNYAGVSVLRSAYKHWYIKDALYKFDSIKHERQGVGVPLIKLPKGYTEKDKTEAKLILKNVRANELGGVILPDGWEFMFADLQAGNTSDLWKSIEHHNQEIANNVLAMFLNLVSGDGGSRALSEDQSDFFLLANEALANLIEDVHNRFLVPELVDFNFDVEDYPHLRHKKLGSVDYGSMANTLSTLSSAGIVNPDEDLEDWARQMIDAPPRMPEPEVEVDEDGNEIDPETGEPILPDDGIDPETGLPLEPEIDPETGLPIEPVLDEEEQAALDEENAGDDELIEASEIAEVDGAVFFHDGNGWVDAQSFRIVSEETKRKISEALKKAKPGDTEQTKMRLKNEAKARKAARHQKALQNARARLAARKGKGKKKGGVIAQKRAARLKKAGVKDSKARQAQNKAGVKEVLNPVTPKKKQSKLKTALKNMQTQKKSSAVKSKMKKAKKPKGSKKPKKVKAPKAAPATKPAANPVGQRAAQQSKDKNSPLYKKPVSTAPKKPVTKLGKAVAARKAKRVAKLGKKKVKAHEDEYEAIFAEGAAHVMMLQKEVQFTKGNLPQGPQFFAEDTFDSWRPLTFAEKKVNFKSIRKSVDKFGSALDSEMNQITADQKADLLSQVKRAVDANDIAAVGVIKAKYTGELSSALTNVQKEMFEFGKSSVALEMGVNAPGTAKEVMGAMKVSNAKMVQKLTSDMENAAADAVSQVVIKKGGAVSATGTAEAVAAASQAIDKVLESTAKISTMMLYGSINLGRAAVWERYPEKVYAFQYSAIIDDATTDVCLSLDGRVVKAGSSDFYTYGPPRHYKCRSIWVEILEDEEYKPDTGDIPSRIPHNATIDQFEDMKKPIVDEKSPAIKVLQAELEERKAQAEKYEQSGQYANRLASHQARIKALEDALGD